MSARSTALAAGALAAAMSVGYLAQSGTAAGIPANKVAAAGSNRVKIAPQSRVVLLEERVKINNPTDLILTASAECSIITQVKTTGNQTQTASANVTMWIEIDGKEVPVAADTPAAGAGHVTFCDRIHQQETKLDGDESDENDDFVRTYLNTKNANAFSWMALNVGSLYPGTDDNVHVVKLLADLTNSPAGTCAPTPGGNTCAQAMVGNRTLILEPVKSAHRETVTDVN